jgi:hypothetical protein
MRKLPEVQQAKELMNDAIDWSVFKWLFEKPRVRKTADQANDALDRLERTVKARWSDEIKAEYKNLTGKTAKVAKAQKEKQEAPQAEYPQIRQQVEKVKEADDAARRARMEAEETFDEAERQLSTDLARQGCKKAIHSWELHEKAIRRAEAVMESFSAGA